MLRGLVEQYKNLIVPIPDWLKSYSEQDKKKHIELKRIQALVRSIVKLVKDTGNSWSSSEGGKIAVLVLASDSIIVLQELVSPSTRWVGGAFFAHILTFFHDHKEIFSVKEFHDGHDYDERSESLGQLPIMDLYDLAVKGKRRFGNLSHVCGLQGFGAPGDVCLACQGKRKHPHSETELPY